MKKLLLIFILLTVVLAACGGSGASEEDCLDAGGTWIDEHNECEDISEAVCTDLDGDFDPCASACRHEEGTVACTQQCVLVCSFN